MRNTREILRQKWLLGRSHRAIAASTGVSVGAVSSHRAHAEWTPSRIVSWAAKVGDATRELCEAILADRPHPEQGLRSCFGILRIGKRYGDARLEAACRRAVSVRARSYRHVESILKHGLDRAPMHDEPAPQLTLTHENVRGRDYYH